jgi:large subunit ribosomal protein L15
VAEKGGRDRAAEIGLHNLKPKPGSRRPRRRVGRGEGSGLGKTSGRGQKGYGSRSGSKKKAGYEGGQNPIHMRMRKLRGPHKKQSMPFENFRTATQPVNVSDLEDRFDAGAEVNPATLKEKGLAKRSDPVKILARGDISKKLEVHAHGFSAAAREKIESAGGSCHTLEP